jgi:hypothetical protein
VVDPLIALHADIAKLQAALSEAGEPDEDGFYTPRGAWIAATISAAQAELRRETDKLDKESMYVI